MNNPNIAQVYDAGTTRQGLPYFVMEFVEGVPLTRYCDENCLTTRDRLELFIHVCEGVQHAHQKGIIHRDIKPSNVLVMTVDGVPIPKIIDFGIAKAIGRQLHEATQVTELGQLIGTPSYMSPEQVGMDPREIDTRTDVYGLGVLLYELLVGAKPFDFSGLSFLRIGALITLEEPPAPSLRLLDLGEIATSVAESRQTDFRSLRKAMLGDLDWICVKALEKEKDRRYSSASEFAQDIRRHLRDEPVLAGPPSATYRAQKFVRRHVLGVIFVAVLALLLSVFSITVFIQNARITEQWDRANREARTSQEVTTFLTDLFSVSDPWQSQRAELTAREILSVGAARVEGELKSEPEIQAGLMHAIGQAYRNLDLLSESRTMLEQGLAIRREILDEDDPLTLSTMSSLAGLYSMSGEYDRAEEAYLKVLEARRRVFGEAHQDTLATSYNLALNSVRQGQLAMAEELLEGTKDLQARTLGEEHPDTLASAFLLATVFAASGQYERAAPILRRVWDIQCELLGRDHPDTLYTQARLVEVLTALGSTQTAEQLCQDCVERMVRVFG
ncbi:MAG: serine/threonine protein kinase, partial [Acidobacteriota bacterium]